MTLSRLEPQMGPETLPGSSWSSGTITPQFQSVPRMMRASG
jgi:hypothetical protein